MTAHEGLTVLVVDDNEAGRYVKAKTLRQAGYVVLEAGDGTSGVELVRTNDLSLVVLDVHLPDMLGFEVCRRLKALQPSLPVLMTSATYVGSKDRSFGLDEGADAYLTEPIEQPVLLSQVRALHRIYAAEQRLREGERRQAFLLQLSDALRSLTDPGEVEGIACRLLAEQLHVDRAYFIEIDGAAGVAHVQRDFVRSGAPSLAGEHRIADFAWSVAILERGDCHVIADTQSSDVVPERDRPACAALAIIACIAAPLIKRGSLLGALCVTAEKRRNWRDSEVDLIRDVGERIWSAIERARAETALRERNRQLDVIAKVSGQLLLESPSSVSAIIDIARIVADELGFEQFFYFIADEQARVLELVGALGLEEVQRELFSRVRFGEYLCGLVAERRERLIVSDLPSASYPEAEMLRKTGVTFYAGFPLVAEGRLIGTLAFATRRRNQPKSGEVRMLQTFSDQAAVQLARNLGEQRLRESEERLRFAYDIAEIAAWDVDLVQNVSVWSPKLFDMLGIEHAKPPYPELLFNQVLPEDLPALRQAYDGSIANRTTFNHEFRIRRRDGEVRHLIGVGRVVAEAGGRPSRMIGINYDNTERKQAEEQIKLLSREISHRSKNMLGLVQAIARQTASGGPTDFLDRFSSRLHSLAAAQDLLVNDAWQGVQLDALVRSQLAHFGDLIGSRITIAGPPVRLPPPAAQCIGMALHELATNAAKYGALSAERGRIEIIWSIAVDRDCFELTWRESGGPRVSAPSRKGFGTTVIGKMVSVSLGGTADLRFSATGLEWNVVCSAADLLRDQVPAFEANAPNIKSGSRRVLLVEDEPLVAHDLASILEAANFTVIGPAGSVAEALAHLKRHDCEAGVLDIYLRNETSEAIAETLLQRSIPFVVVSAYLANQQPQIFSHAPRVPKPVSAKSLVSALNELMMSS